jgi:hypothetical protein
MLGETDEVEVKCGLVVFQWRMPSFFVGGITGAESCPFDWPPTSEAEEGKLLSFDD